eukprot:11201395-Lingulodinium_polyedra.AAC.1
MVFDPRSWQGQRQETVCVVSDAMPVLFGVPGRRALASRSQFAEERARKLKRLAGQPAAPSSCSVAD